jgi:hypothetical protein
MGKQNTDPFLRIKLTEEMDTLSLFPLVEGDLFPIVSDVKQELTEADIDDQLKYQYAKGEVNEL